MSVFRLHPRSCERAREWASLRLDGELSELEQAHLRSHLERCASCASYVASVVGATDALRGTPAEQLSEPVALPVRRRTLPLRASQMTAAAAVVTAAVGLGSLLGSVGVNRPPARIDGSVRSGAAPATVSDDVLVRGPRLALLQAEKGIGKQQGLGLNV